MTDSAITTDDTTIATTGRETLAFNVTGLGTNEPADGVAEEARVGTDELLRVGVTKTKEIQVKSATNELVKVVKCSSLLDLVMWHKIG